MTSRKIIFGVVFLAVSISGAYAFALSCSWPSEVTTLTLSSVTIDGDEASTTEYDGFDVQLWGYDTSLTILVVSPSGDFHENYHEAE